MILSVAVDQFNFEKMSLFKGVEANRANLWHIVVSYVLGVAESESAVCQAQKLIFS